VYFVETIVILRSMQDWRRTSVQRVGSLVLF